MDWLLGSIHPLYGEVVAMLTTDGEPYRMFRDDEGSVALTPLGSLGES